jgi:flagellar FliL protein
MSKAVPQATAAKAPRGRMVKWIILIVIILCSVGSGMLAPRFLAGTSLLGGGEGAKKEAKRATIPFGEVVVNLHEERLTRYLRVKIILVVDGNHEKELTEKINQNQVFMQSWLNAYLADKSIKEVSGTTGQNRLRREILENFNNLLEPAGAETIQEVLFKEFVVQ